MTFKVLLLGEFSGFYANLASGLRAIGHDVTIAAGYDGYKNIRPDIPLETSNSNRSLTASRYIMPFVKLPQLKNFDIVQVVHPFTPNLRYFPNYSYLNYLKKMNGKLFLSAAGSDPVYWQIARKNLPYGPFDDYLKYDIKKEVHKFQTSAYLDMNTKIVSLFDGIIPIMYDYYAGYRSFETCGSVIPLPVDTKKMTYDPPDFSRQPLRVFHGLTRYGFKGTKYVADAFEQLSQKYPRDIVCSIEGKLPLGEYLKLMAKQHVVVDQVNSHSMGMNALFSLASGKVTLSGSEPVADDLLYGMSSPALNILPNVKQIMSQLTSLLDIRNELSDLSAKGHDFICQHHCSIKVAQQYLNEWTKS